MRTELITEALPILTEREQMVMDGIAHGEKMTKMAKEFNCSVGRIRSIRNRAVKKLRKSILEKELASKL